jgi:hypothetical protein
MGETCLKILYAGEDETVEINDQNDIVVTGPNGEV